MTKDGFTVDGLAETVGRNADDEHRRMQARLREEAASIDASLPQQDPEAVERILANGRRRFGSLNVGAEQTAHGRAVRAAYSEGCGLGSRGILSDPEITHWWKRSRAASILTTGEMHPAADMIGRVVMSSDPRASRHMTWRIAGFHKGRAWIVSGPHDLIVATESLRALC